MDERCTLSIMADEWHTGWPPEAATHAGATEGIAGHLRANEIGFEPAVCEAFPGARALWSDALALRGVLARAGVDPESLEKLAPRSGEIALVVSDAPPEALESLARALLAEPPLGSWPSWVVCEGEAEALLAPLENRSPFVPAGSLTMQVGPTQHVLAIYRERQAGRQPFEAAAFPEKIGEGPDQLRERERWFTKRHGGRKR